MRRVLVVTYYWPPSGGSGVQRWVKFCKYLPTVGWEPVVLAPEHADYPFLDDTLEESLPAGIQVLRCPIHEPYAMYRRWLGGKGAASRDMGAVTAISSGRKTWKQRLALWIRANLFVPDPRVGWVRPAVQMLREWLAEHPVDAMVTTGPPHSVHLIGLELRRRTGLPWVADFRDPWTEMYYLRYLPMTRRTWDKLYRMQQAVLDGCSAVLSVTPQVQDDLRARTHTPVAMIPNGFDEDDFAVPPPPGDGFFNLVHTGLLASDGNPSLLWEVLGAMVQEDAAFGERLRICLCGKTDAAVLASIRACGLGAHLVDRGYLVHADAVAVQRGASLLLLPLRNDPKYKPILPGKLFEYLAARRPVLGIGQCDGAMAQVLSQTRAGVTVDWEDRDALRAALRQAWEAFREGGIPDTDGDISAYSRRHEAAELARLLDQTLQTDLAT